VTGAGGGTAPRPDFTCLWCGTRTRTRSSDDLEAWAQLCSDCLGRAGENPFLRYRLRAALEARAQARPAGGGEARAGAPRAPASSAQTMPSVPVATGGVAPGMEPTATASPSTLGAQLAPPPDDPDGLDDWYVGRGAHERGPVMGATWQAELDVAVLAVDALGLDGRIVEPRCGVGFWSVLLATMGELTALDDRPGMLDRARDRLVAHRLRAHLHEEDPFAAPAHADAGAFDAAFVGMTLSQLAAARRSGFLAATRARLRPGGRLVVVDLGRPELSADELRSAVDHLLGDAFVPDSARSTGRHIVIITARARP
jgi:hypothetical protein